MSHVPAQLAKLISLTDWLTVEEFNLNDFFYVPSSNIALEVPNQCGFFKDAGIKNALVGRNTYKLNIGVLSPNIIIGRYCSISHFTHIGATHHHMDHLSTGILAANGRMFNDEPPEPVYTIIGCDVWVGLNSTILGGARIGHGACIGAGSVVKKEIPPYAIAVGSPARVIRQRFSDEIVADLLALQWWTLDPLIIEKLPHEDIRRCIEELKEIRKQYPVKNLSSAAGK